MSKSNAKKLVDKLSKDTKFREELLAEEAKVALKFAKKAGLECTAEELKEISAGITLRNISDGIMWITPLGAITKLATHK